MSEVGVEGGYFAQGLSCLSTWSRLSTMDRKMREGDEGGLPDLI